ncbi:MAG TPA: FAD:protein FMN transferase [Chloroflexia bacterium]|nr:FAD:protein FMN transferase [Chloroflexia bacterium]
MTRVMMDEVEKAELREVSLNFRAMNTGIELLIYTTEAEKAVQTVQQIEALFATNEATLSRFRPESELSELNHKGYLENASELLYRNVVAARRMQALTGGIFDPTILDALEAAGYDRSFEMIAGRGPQLFARNPLIHFSNQRTGGEAWIELDETRRSIRLAPGVRVDLGGIAKGTTVDQAADLLRREGFDSFMVSAGGDMYLRGCPPQDSRGWNVLVEDPVRGNDATITSLQVANKAVATSSTMGRRWQLGGQTRHHLIDPRTNQPADTGLASVTVVAEAVQFADVMAKTALILGPEKMAESTLMEKAQLSSIIFVTLEGKLIQL